MVPEGWKKLSLATVAEVRTGVAKGKQNLKNPVELPYLRVANVQDGYIDISDVKSIQIEKEQIERYSLKAGDVLMTEGGDFDKLGRGDVWNGEISPCLHQNHVFAVRTNKSKVTPHFLAALSASRYGKAYFLGCSKKSTNLASINSTQLKEFPVLVPPLAEQGEITKILSAWDNAITVTQKLHAKSQMQKKALMQQLLTGKNRFYGFSKLPWKMIKVDEIFSTVSDRKYHGEKLLAVTQDNGVIPRSILDRKVVMPEGHTDNYKLVNPGDFVISLRSFQGGLEYSSYRGLVSPAYNVLRAKIPIVDSFYRHYFKSYQFIGHLAIAVIGIRDGKQISLSDFSFLSLPYPSFDEQKLIASVLDSADNEIANLRRQLESLKDQKKALMQQLLTGKRRVKVDES